jgi:hypothetical protein
MLITKNRDLTLIQQRNDKTLTIACDSCGGIGNSELDVVKVNEEIVGYFTARVCLFETLAFRSKPLVLVNTLSVEMNGRGEKLLKGIHRAINEYNEAKFYEEFLSESVTGSTEENIPTLQTAMGITLIGEKENGKEKKKVISGDILVLIGIPKVGYEVIEDESLAQSEVISFRSLKILSNDLNSIDLLPVGSKGIKYEIGVLEREHSLILEMYDVKEIDLVKSGGPSTCVIAIMKEEEYQLCQKVIKEPATKLGVFL